MASTGHIEEVFGANQPVQQRRQSQDEERI
jgi:hypothetical protein